MPKFAEILTKSAESIERPPLPPKGTYEFVITAQAKTREITGYEVVDFPVRGVNAMEDVDSADLKAYGAPKNVVVNYEVYDAGLKMYDAILEKCRDNRNAQELARMLRPLPDEAEWRAADMRTADADSACPPPRAQRKRVRAGRR